MVWSNAHPWFNLYRPAAASLAGETNWVDYVELPTSNSVKTNQIIDLHPPTGMALVLQGHLLWETT